MPPPPPGTQGIHCQHDCTASPSTGTKDCWVTMDPDSTLYNWESNEEDVSFHCLHCHNDHRLSTILYVNSCHSTSLVSIPAVLVPTHGQGLKFSLSANVLYEDMLDINIFYHKKTMVPRFKWVSQRTCHLLLLCSARSLVWHTTKLLATLMMAKWVTNCISNMSNKSLLGFYIASMKVINIARPWILCICVLSPSWQEI